MSMDFERLRARIGHLESQAHEVLASVSNIVEDGLELLESLTNATGQDEPVAEEYPKHGVFPETGEWFTWGGKEFWYRCLDRFDRHVHVDAAMGDGRAMFNNRNVYLYPGCEETLETSDVSHLPEDIRALLAGSKDEPGR